jgi:hypothetical protein
MFNESCIDLVKTNKSVSPVKRVNGKRVPMKRVYKTSDVFKISNIADGVITECIVTLTQSFPAQVNGS